MDFSNYLNLDIMMDRLVLIDKELDTCVDLVADTLYKNSAWENIPFDGLEFFPVYKRRIIAMLTLKDALLSGKACNFEYLFRDENTSKIMQIFALIYLPMAGEALKDLHTDLIVELSHSLEKSWQQAAYDLINDKLEKIRDSDAHDRYDESLEVSYASV